MYTWCVCKLGCSFSMLGSAFDIRASCFARGFGHPKAYVSTRFKMAKRTSALLALARGLRSELEELTRQMDQEALAKPELEARRTTLLQHLQVVQLSIEKPSKQSEQRFVKTLLEIQETELLNESSEQLASSWSLDLAPSPKWSSAWKPRLDLVRFGIDFGCF